MINRVFVCVYELKLYINNKNIWNLSPPQVKNIFKILLIVYLFTVLLKKIVVCIILFLKQWVI